MKEKFINWITKKDEYDGVCLLDGIQIWSAGLIIIYVATYLHLHT